MTALRPLVRAARSAGTAHLPILCPDHPAWATRHDVLRVYRSTLIPAQRPSCASAVTHMYANRLLGDTERVTRALGAGHDGGRIVFEGTPADLIAARCTFPGQHLTAYVGI